MKAASVSGLFIGFVHTWRFAWDVPSPRKPALDFHFKGEAEKRADQHDETEDGEILDSGFDNDGPDQVRSHQKFDG